MVSPGHRVMESGFEPGCASREPQPPPGEWTGPWDRSCSWLFLASVPQSHWARLLGVTGGGHNHPGAPQEGTLLPSQPPSPIRASICSLKGKGGGGEGIRQGLRPPQPLELSHGPLHPGPRGLQQETGGLQVMASGSSGGCGPGLEGLLAGIPRETCALRGSKLPARWPPQWADQRAGRWPPRLSDGPLGGHKGQQRNTQTPSSWNQSLSRR